MLLHCYLVLLLGALSALETSNAHQNSDQWEVTPEWLRRSSLASDVPELDAYIYLAKAGEKAFPAYEVILADAKSDPRLVVQICYILIERKEDRSRFLPSLRKRMIDPSTQVRCWSSFVVGLVGTKEDLPLLIATLSSDHDHSVKVAASGVARIGGESGLAALEIWLLSTHGREASDVRDHVTRCRDDLRKRLDAARKAK